MYLFQIYSTSGVQHGSRSLSCTKLIIQCRDAVISTTFLVTGRPPILGVLEIGYAAASISNVSLSFLDKIGNSTSRPTRRYGFIPRNGPKSEPFVFQFAIQKFKDQDI